MRVALLTNFVAPYRLPVFRALQSGVDELRILVSTEMESNRGYWQPEWAGLDVVVQKSWTIQRTWRHERFSEPLEMHIPYDTLAQLKHWRPDVIISGELGSRSLQSMLYGKTARVPVVIWATLTEHLEQSRGLARKLVRRAMAPAVYGFIVNGESGARYIRSLGVADGRIFRIPQAIDLAPYTAIPLERNQTEQRKLLFCGAVSQLKSADLLIAAMQQLGAQQLGRSFSLTVVGDGPLRAQLEQVALPANVEVTWIGAMPYDALPQYYARTGILLFPTQGDEWGLVVNEAMAAGLPVIGSEYSQAVDELVVEGVNGWRFKPDSADAIARAVIHALDTPDAQLASMRAQARDTAVRITPDFVADRFVDVLKQAVALRK